jgi:DNA polymerase I
MSAKRVVILDCLNLFYVNYTINPSISPNGLPVGGVLGFLKLLNKLSRIMKPDEMVLVWDGVSSSSQRRQINENYKQGRRAPTRLNRNIEFTLSDEQENENKMWQLSRLSCEYLNLMPLPQIMLQSCEADDVISYVSSTERYKGWKKIIVSSDKDFIQLISDEVFLYRPSQKEIINTQKVLDEFGIHPYNFALARAIVGDKSDNLEGVKGLGLTTLAKRYEFLKEAKKYTISDVISFANSLEDQKAAKLVCYENVKQNEALISKNYQIMNLSEPMLTPSEKRVVEETLEEFRPTFNKTKTRILLFQDGLEESYLQDLFEFFNKLTRKDYGK